MSIVTRLCRGFFVLAFLLITPAISFAAVNPAAPAKDLCTVSNNDGTTLDSFIAAYGLQELLNKPGQQQNIPGGSNGSKTHYVVKAGDNLSMIGQQYGVGYREIMIANSLHDTMIYPGMELLIPAAGSVVATADYSGTRAVEVSRGGYFTRTSPEDVDLLARLISAEAEGEPYEGKVAVGAVVINRVLDPRFPNTIQDVIYDANQFPPAHNGRINLPASADSLSAAKDALGGWDPSNGALYFFAGNARSRNISAVIGNHVFTY